MSYLFVFRTYSDIDHMAPLAWKLLEEGEHVHAIVSPGYDPESDYRLRFLRSYPRFELHEIHPGPHGSDRGRRILGRAAGLVRRSLPFAAGFLVRHRVKVVAVEWGYGFQSGYDRPRSPAGVVAALRSFAGSVRRAGEPGQTRTNFMVAAKWLGRATVCLPHGLSIKLDSVTSEKGEADLAAAGYDWSDRNRFDAYVLNTEHQLQYHLDRVKGDPDVMHNWGSLRWDPQWFERNRRLAPAFDWPSDAGLLKVVFMVPKWGNRVHAEAVPELVKRLQSLDFVSLALKAHPRPEEGGADALRADPEIAWERIHDVGGVDSVSLIAASDVVIDVGSSIGIEVAMQEKVLLYPEYIHELTTVFDTVPRSCVVAHSADEVVDYLRAHADGSPHQVPEAAARELLRQVVYGSRPEPYDVLDRYYRGIRQLGNGNSRSPKIGHHT